MSVLNVCVVQAYNIPRTVFFAGSDLYVTLQVSTASATQRTKVIENTQWPIWNEMFHFYITDQSKSVLKCTVKSKSATEDDQDVGTIEIQLSKLPMLQVSNKEYELKLAVADERGHVAKVRLALQITPPGQPSCIAQVAPGQVSCIVGRMGVGGGQWMGGFRGAK